MAPGTNFIEGNFSRDWGGGGWGGWRENGLGSDSKMSAYNVEDPGLIPGWGRSSGEGNGNPLQYSCLENSMDEGAW